MDEPIADADFIDQLGGARQGRPGHARLSCAPRRPCPMAASREIMAEVTSAGYKKVALVTEPDTH